MDLKILSWNIEGTKYYTSTNFKKIRPILEKIEADIFCLQEGQEFLAKLNEFQKFKDFKHIFSHEDNDGLNVILSRFPIIVSGEISIPLSIKYPPGKVLWADIKVNKEIIKIYNCHFGVVSVGPLERANLLKFIFNDSKKHSGPVVICGDLNTTIPAAGLKRKIVQLFHKEKNSSLLTSGKYPKSDERYSLVNIANHSGFKEAVNISKSTWGIRSLSLELFKLKLDWFLTRNIRINKVVLGDFVSDHRSVYAEFSIK